MRADLGCELGDRPCPFAAAPPVSWRAQADRVDDVLARRHEEDSRWQTAQEQTARVARLISGGHLRPTLLHTVVA